MDDKLLEDRIIILNGEVNENTSMDIIKNVVEVMGNIRKRLYKNNEKINQNYMVKITLSMENITLMKQKQK